MYYINITVGIERFFHGEFTHPIRSIHRDQRNNIQAMGVSQSYDTPVDRHDLSNHRDQSVGDGHSPCRTATATATPSKCP